MLPDQPLITDNGNTLRGTEVPYRDCVESMNEGVVTLLPDGTITYSNPCFTEMVKVPREQVMGSSFIRFLSSQQKLLFNSLMERTGNRGGKAEFTLFAGDGSTVPVQLCVRTLADPTGDGLCLVISDLAEQKWAELEHSYPAIVESSDDAIIGKSPEGVIQSWNSGAERLYGYVASEVIGQSILLLAPPERREEIVGLLKQINHGKRIESYETERVTKDGRRVDVSVTISPLKNASGEVIRASMIAREITERKRAEAALRDSEERYRVLYESSRNAIIMLSPPEWKFTAGNPAAIALFGARDEREFVDAAPWSLSPEYQPDGELSSVKARQMIDAAMERGSHFFEWTHTKFSGEEFFAAVTLTRMINRGQPLLQATVGDITEGKRIAVELQERQDFAEAVLDCAQSGIIACDERGVLTLSNQVAREIFGLPQEAIPAEGWAHHYDFYLADGKTLMKKEDVPLLRALQGENLTNVEMMIVPKHGEPRVVMASARPITDSEGRNLGAVAAFHDITAHKLAKDGLWTSEIRYRRLFEEAHDGILILDADSGEIEDVNPYLTDLLGFCHADLLGKKLWDIGPLRDVLLSKVSFSRLQNEGHIRYEDLPLETRDGKNIDVEFVSNVYLAGHQRVIQCNIRDITERKRAEAEHVRLVTAIEQSAEAVVITNTSGDIEYVNPAFTRITGYSREEVLGQNPRILKSDKQDPAFYQQLWATILKGEIWHGELINRRKDGSLYTEEMNIAPVRDSRGEITHFIATKQDVTERKTLEEQAQPGGENGGDRQVGGWSRPRFQQPPDHH